MTDHPHLPVRVIPIGTRSITGTMPGGARFESALERDLMYILRFDINVDKYIAQPVKIEYRDKDGKLRSYTPDIVIYHRKDILPAKNMPTILGEVKYRDDLRKNFKELRPKFKAAIHYAKERGWKFKLLTDREIRTPYLVNAKFLLGYKNPDPYPKFEIVQMVLDRVRELRETDVETLLVSIYRDKWNQAELLPVVWHLIAIRRIGNDLTQPITMRSKIWRMGE
ncbi:MAG: TnsA endonuclease N-terminal domain-containing protein [Gallionellaceae bacterium]|nr:TnsA endonuclease N-terminal domain-containing protein [Gallionellaceae bacterium]